MTAKAPVPTGPGPLYSAEYGALLQILVMRIFAVIIAAHHEARRRLNEKGEI